MLLKESVSVVNLQPPILLAIMIVNELFKDFGYACVITSISDGVHMSGSLHAKGLAVDFRTHNVSSKLMPQLVAVIKQAMPSQYDIILEVDHLHIEFDPK
jgi:hypothetical protein